MLFRSAVPSRQAETHSDVALREGCSKVRRLERRPETGCPTGQRSDKPGPDRTSQSRGWRRGKEPQGSRHLLGENAAFHVLKSSEGQEAELARCPRPGEKGSPSRGGADQSRKGIGNRRRGLLSASRALEGLTRQHGAVGPMMPRTRDRARSKIGWVEGLRRGRRKLRRGETQESIGRRPRGNPESLRTDSRGEQSSEVGEAGGTE